MAELQDYSKFNGHRRFCRQFLLLKGILSGICADRIIAKDEIDELFNWCLLNREFIRYQPFRELIPTIEKACEDNVITDDELADILWIIDTFERDDIIQDIQSQMILKMQGLLHGLLADGHLNNPEIYSLQKWIEENDFLRGTYPYDEIDAVLTSILSDQIITPDERNMLTATIAEYIGTDDSLFVNRPDIEALKKEYQISGICSSNPDICVADKMFCFTGISTRADRNEIANLIEKNGGKYHDTVTKTTDYLIVGNESNPCWAYSCYGRKVEKARDIRKNGGKIVIVNEVDFWDSL